MVNQFCDYKPQNLSAKYDIANIFYIGINKQAPGQWPGAFRIVENRQPRAMPVE